MLAHPAFARSAYRDAILASGPLRYYRCNETGGAILRDLKGVEDAVIIGTPTRMGAEAPPGISDGGGFQTTSGSGGCASAGSANLPSTAYTIAAWTKGGSVADRGIFGNWSNAGTTAGGLIYRSSSTKLGFIQNSTNLVASNTNDADWHFAVGTWDGTNCRFYVDGVLVGGPSAAGAPGGVRWVINTYFTGSSYTTRITTGITAECVLWSRALPLGEIAHFNALGR